MKETSKKRPLSYVWTQDCVYKEGIFLKPHGKWIVRVKGKGKGGYSTLCQFDSQEQAQAFFDEYCLERENSSK